jgi:hypothetical protein
MADNSFFLDSDDAKSMGDVEYMRQPKRVRRTFPATFSQPGHKELNVEVSADTKRQSTAGNFAVDESGSTSPAVAPTTYQAPTYQAPTYQAPAPAPAAETSSFGSGSISSSASADAANRRKVDTSMDMFRSMAKKVGR